MKKRERHDQTNTDEWSPDATSSSTCNTTCHSFARVRGTRTKNVWTKRLRQVRRRRNPSHTVKQANRQNTQESEEDVERAEGVSRNDRELPRDSYSLLFVAKLGSRTFYLALIIFGFQVATLSLVLADLLDYPEGNPTLNAPPGVSGIVTASQFLALIISVVTQGDLIASLNLLDRETLKCKFLPALSFIGRLVVGVLGLVVTFIIVVQSSNVIDLFADFAAMAFVSGLDNMAFELASNGFFSHILHIRAAEVEELRFSRGGKITTVLRWAVILVILIPMILCWAWITSYQLQGKFLCRSITVQVGSDDYISYHSGVYEWDGETKKNGRAVFIEKHFPEDIDELNRRGVLGYCSSVNSWTFTDNYTDYDPCNWRMKSPRTESYDLTDVPSSEWMVLTQLNGPVPASYFSISCNECNTRADCSFYGECNQATQGCECDEGRFGLICEFRGPCPSIETDIGKQFPGLPTKYEPFLDRNNKTVMVYGRPVYVSYDGNGAFNVVVFTGRRWVVMGSDYLVINDQQLADYLATFHGWHSDWNTNYVSDPTVGGTPAGLKWYEWITSAGIGTQEEGNGLGILESIDALFICADCSVSDHEDACREGQCVQEGHNYTMCKCYYGWSGLLCHIAPVRAWLTLTIQNGGDSCITCGEEAHQDLYVPDPEIPDDDNFNWGLNWTTQCLPYPVENPLRLGANATPGRLAYDVNQTHFLIYFTQDERYFQVYDDSNTTTYYDGHHDLCDDAMLVHAVQRPPGKGLIHAEFTIEINSTNKGVLVGDNAINAVCPDFDQRKKQSCSQGSLSSDLMSNLTRAWVNIRAEIGGQADIMDYDSVVSMDRSRVHQLQGEE